MSGGIVDQEARNRATDPLHSYCVSAPAGSGKTELLIQRMLTLLARVDYPEEILAITFTRKAAAEMRARIVAALRSAATEACPSNRHSALTWELASAALERDQLLDWQLLNNPGRLAIRTIDSFCASLTRQMPILSGFGGRINPVDDALPVYREATRALLDSLGSKHPIAEDLGRVLLQFDGNWSRLEELLISMLMCRDQWLVHMGRGLAGETPQHFLARSVTRLVEDSLAIMLEHLGEKVDTWFELYSYSCDQLGLPAPGAAPGTSAEDLPRWRAMASLCLTAGDEWRKTVNKNQGFPVGSDAERERKQAFLDLLQSMREIRGSLEQLREIRHLPSLESDDEHWQLLQAVSRLLPMLAAQLTVAFQQRAEVDHTQIAMAALAALGDDDHATDLAQKLDYRLRHILVDEFQDTAVTQYSLLERLTRGWAEENAANPGNPRTLFIVGDGMQSIYGFRDADVGLFVRARESGFNGVTLEALDLLSNFRSDAQLVDWVNQVFQPAFPARDNMRFGEISFSHAVPERPAIAFDPVNLHCFDKAAAADLLEANWLVDRVEEGLADSDCESIAILVRNRTHLYSIVDELKARGISWQAQDIDLLASSPVVMDLQTLCRALHNYSDRVAWLALLRAPWCALSLADLDAVAGAASGQSIWRALQQSPVLSEEGTHRVERLLVALRSAMHWRERLGLRDWIESAWLALGGPACATSPAQLQDAAEFFALLEARDNQGQPYDELLLSQQVASLYSSASSGDSKLQLMTLHKAKGLEFDWVFVPGLSRTSRTDDRALLLWDDYHRSPDSELGFLMAVDDQERSEEPTLYNFLQRQKKRQRESEATRLLYVGVTRAVKRLFLSAALDRDEENGDWKAPPGRSLLSSIWPSFESGMHESGGQVAQESSAATAGELLRVLNLPELALPPAGDQQGELPEDRNVPKPAGDPLSRLAGTVVHLALQRLSRLDDDALVDLEVATLRPWLQLQLRRLGVPESALAAALARVQQSTELVLADERGRHIISASRERAHSELSLSALRQDGRLSEYLIDRTYVEDNVRWVVDYKSSVPDSGQSLEDFLAQEAERYRPQLGQYRSLLAARDEIPVKTALYFTAIPHWLEL